MLMGVLSIDDLCFVAYIAWDSHTQLVEIMDIKIFTLLSVLFMYCYANQKCPVNCECLEIMSMCDILFCDDELYVDMTLLMVEGCMCPHHYDVLS